MRDFLHFKKKKKLITFLRPDVHYNIVIKIIYIIEKRVILKAFFLKRLISIFFSSSI